MYIYVYYHYHHNRWSRRSEEYLHTKAHSYIIRHMGYFGRESFLSIEREEATGETCVVLGKAYTGFGGKRHSTNKVDKLKLYTVGSSVPCKLSAQAPSNANWSSILYRIFSLCSIIPLLDFLLTTSKAVLSRVFIAIGIYVYCGFL